MTILELKLTDIIIDDGILLRPLDEKLAKQYAEAMRHRDPFPPVDVFHNGKRYYLADGRHRVRGAAIAKRDTINADVEKGGAREARLFACGANATHGRPRLNAEKQLAVRRLLLDDEWREWSNREIAKKAGRVKHDMVVKMRGKLEQAGEIPPRSKAKFKRGGKVHKMTTKRASGPVARQKRPKRKRRTQDQIHEEEAQSAIDITRGFPHDGREGARRWTGIVTEHARYMRDFWVEFVAERG